MMNAAEQVPSDTEGGPSTEKGLPAARGYLRTRAQQWRPEVSPEDTSPTWQPDRADLTEWGVTQGEARDMLRRQVCPVCGEGPWKSPLNHAAKKHGIDRRTMREACGMTSVEVVADPELSARIADRMRAADVTPLLEASRRGPRGKYKMTEAGRAATAANFAAVSTETRRANAAKSKTEEAQAKRSATFRAKAATCPLPPGGTA